MNPSLKDLRSFIPTFSFKLKQQHSVSILSPLEDRMLNLQILDHVQIQRNQEHSNHSGYQRLYCNRGFPIWLDHSIMFHCWNMICFHSSNLINHFLCNQRLVYHQHQLKFWLELQLVHQLFLIWNDIHSYPLLLRYPFIPIRQKDLEGLVLISLKHNQELDLKYKVINLIFILLEDMWLFHRIMYLS